MPQEKQTLEVQDAKLNRRLDMTTGDPEKEKLDKLYASRKRRGLGVSSVIELTDEDEQALDDAWEEESKYQEKRNEKSEGDRNEKTGGEN